MKKRLLYIAVVIVMLSLITGGTLAYFTAEDIARNEITAGAVTVRVEEYALVDGTLQPYSAEAIRVMPGHQVSKIAVARSMEQPAWVRMHYAVTVQDTEGTPMTVSSEELEKVILFAGRDENWSHADGWWYYSQAVGAGEATQPLFETVTFSAAEMGNEYQGCTALIHVTVQAVQKANNGETVFEAAGWPAE